MLPDRHRELIEQTRAANRRSQAKPKPVPNRIGDRDPITGQHRTIYPDGSEGANGRKLYDAHSNKSDTVTGLPLSDGTIGLLGQKGELSPLALPEQEGVRGIATQGALKTNEVGYINGQVWSYEEEEPVAIGQIKFATLIQRDDTLEFWLCGHQAKAQKVYTMPFVVFSALAYPGLKASDQNFFFDLRCDSTGKLTTDWCITFGLSTVISYELGNVSRSNKLLKLTKAGLQTILEDEDTGVSDSVDTTTAVDYVNFGNGYWKKQTSVFAGNTVNRTITYYWQGKTFAGASLSISTPGIADAYESGTVYPYPGQAYSYEFTPSPASGFVYQSRSLVNSFGTAALGDGRSAFSFENYLYQNGSVVELPPATGFLYNFSYDQISVLKSAVARITTSLGSNQADYFGEAGKRSAMVDLFALDTMLLSKTVKMPYYRIKPFEESIVLLSNLSCFL